MEEGLQRREGWGGGGGFIRCQDVVRRWHDMCQTYARGKWAVHRIRFSNAFAVRLISPPLTTESPTTHYCTVQHHVPIDPYAERMPRADCSSNTP